MSSRHPLTRPSLSTPVTHRLLFSDKKSTGNFSPLVRSSQMWGGTMTLSSGRELFRKKFKLILFRVQKEENQWGWNVSNI